MLKIKTVRRPTGRRAAIAVDPMVSNLRALLRRGDRLQN
jgi:hypothetical protein